MSFAIVLYSVPVPCSECPDQGVCCRSKHLVIGLNESEGEHLRGFPSVDGDMAKGENDECPYLSADGKICTLSEEKRPWACRVYDCRCYYQYKHWEPYHALLNKNIPGVMTAARSLLGIKTGAAQRWE